MLKEHSELITRLSRLADAIDGTTDAQDVRAAVAYLRAMPYAQQVHDALNGFPMPQFNFGVKPGGVFYCNDNVARFRVFNDCARLLHVSILAD